MLKEKIRFSGSCLTIFLVGYMPFGQKPFGQQTFGLHDVWSTEQLPVFRSKSHFYNVDQMPVGNFFSMKWCLTVLMPNSKNMEHTNKCLTFCQHSR
jgi:hypothetical protein